MGTGDTIVCNGFETVDRFRNPRVLISSTNQCGTTIPERTKSSHARMGCASSKGQGEARGRSTSSMPLQPQNNGSSESNAAPMIKIDKGGPLTEKAVEQRTITSGVPVTVKLVDNQGSPYTIRYAYVSQRGYYQDGNSIFTSVIRPLAKLCNRG